MSDWFTSDLHINHKNILAHRSFASMEEMNETILRMFDDVRNLIGDRLFFKALKNYVTKYQGQNATPDNLISVFENTASKRIKKIFVSYIDGSAIIGELKKE